MWLDVAFSSTKTGLATVGYRIYKGDGTDAQARTTTGVDEIGHGAYGVELADATLDTLIAAGGVGIEWDTGEGSPQYAMESLAVYRVPENLFGYAVEGAMTHQELLRCVLSSACNESDRTDNGDGTYTFHFYAIDGIAGAKQRLTATTDAHGSRSSVVRDPSD